MSEYRFSAQLSEHQHLHVQTDSLEELGRALVFFGLANANNAQPNAAQQELPLAAAVEEPAAPKQRKPRAVKSEPAATPAAAETALPETAAAAPAAESPSEGNAAAEVSEQEAPAAQTASSSVPAPSATPAEAADAVRAYGAKFGITAARELLQKHGFAKTADITAEEAGEIVAAASAA